MGNHFVPSTDSRSDEFKNAGLIFSLGTHVVLFLCLIFNFGSGWGQFEQPVVYSVTIEGGKKLGGMSQVPDKNNKSQVAPPKNVSSTQKKAEEQTKEEVKPEEKSVEEKAVPLKKEEPKIDDKAPVAPIETPKVVEPKKVQETPKEKTTDPKKTEAAKKPDLKKPEAKKDSQGDVNKKLDDALQRYLGESSNAGGSGFGAAAVGGNGMGGGVVRPPEFFAYLKKLEEYVKSGWVWSDTGGRPKAQVVFDIAPDGKISNVLITKGSGLRAYDDSVLSAIGKASPVPPPPPSVYQFFSSVRMTFDPAQ